MPTSTFKKWPIWGHERIIKSLQNSILKDRLAHAYLFSGPPSIGKMTVAKYFIKAIQCQARSNRPCGKCSTCIQIEKNIHPDVLIIDHGDSIKIDEMRELQHKFSLHSLSEAYKVCLINNAQDMTEEAANSILKFLEEPKGKTVIILITESIQAMLPTIVSRSCVIKFLPVPIELIKKKLYNLTKDIKKAKCLACASLGRPGLAKTFLNQPGIIKEQIEVINKLKKLSQAFIFERINFVFSLVKDKNNILKILDIWLSYFRDLLLVGQKRQNLLTSLSRKDSTRILKYSSKKILSIIKHILLTKSLLNQNINLRLALENLVLNL